MLSLFFIATAKHSDMILIEIVYYFLILIVPTIFAWGFSAIKNKYVKTGFALIGLYYIHIFIMNQDAFELIEWIMYIVIFVFGVRTCKKYGYEKKIIFYSLLALVCFEIFVLVWSASETILDNVLSEGNHSILEIFNTAIIFQTITFLSLWFAYYCGFWFVKTKKLFVKIILPIVIILLALFLLKFVRIEIEQRFNENKGTWTGEVVKPAKFSNLEFYTDSTLQVKININDLNKKIYVLDFSNPGCGNCFRQMPKFQQLMEKYKDNSEIGFYTIYVYNDTTDIAWFERYTAKHNITIPHLFIDIKDSAYIQAFDYHAFPQYNIIKNDTIIFDGYLEILDFFEHKYLK
ncbi:MAG: thioredoxin family protein [Prevotellaceae bacterium]|jgi:thiol-disulfide isomerase/thioredoxin|nr:thioredoxin family protein [Prevotellaceae bacterium]